MFLLLLNKALLQHRARTWRVIFAVALGTAVTTAVLGASIGISDQVRRELLSYGANIEIVPNGGAAGTTVDLGGVRYQLDEQSSIPVAKLGALKTTFWKNNIVGFAPFLKTTADLDSQPISIRGTWFDRPVAVPDDPTFRTGLRKVEPWWQVTGRWPSDDDTNTCLVGASAAAAHHIAVGSHVALIVMGHALSLTCVGIARTGGPEENDVVVPLESLQRWMGMPGRAQRVEVSAIIKPDDALAHKDATKLSDADRERLICSPYIGAVLQNIKDALPGVDARPIYRVADSQGRLLGRVDLLMGLVLIAALLAAVLGAGSATVAAAIERRSEVGLIKALGANSSSLMIQHAAEAAAMGFAGGVIGVPAGLLLQLWIDRVVFGTAGAPPWIAAPIGLVVALGVALIAGLLPLWSASHLDPVQVLGEEG